MHLATLTVRTKYIITVILVLQRCKHLQIYNSKVHINILALGTAEVNDIRRKSEKLSYIGMVIGLENL